MDVAVTGAEEPTSTAESIPPYPGGFDSIGDAGDGATVACSVCGSEALPGELFCENCGAPLPGTVAAGPAGGSVEGAAGGSAGGAVGGAASSDTQPINAEPVNPVCANCGGTTFQDGYCSTCGAPAVKERDHFQEQPAPWVAAVSDRGIRHHRNEDAMALSALAEPGSRAVLVVCDGVSSSMDPDIASLAGARAARDVLTISQSGSPSIAGRITTWTDLLAEAAKAANEQAIAAYRNPTNRPGERQNNPPSCTFVAAVVDGPVIVVGWVGDSRAYWIPDSGPAEMLSIDDSWASEAIAAGMSRADAEAAPRAHAITRWLGVDSPDSTPRTAATTPEGPGWLLVCSDGLWNYCSPAPEMAVLVARTASDHDGDPLRTAAALVDWANAQGGMDNITVALARLNPQPTS